MSSRTHWKALVNPDYIGAYALPDGEDLTVTIEFVRREEVTGTGGKKEECTVARLVDQKPMILNMTNSKMIAKLYGPFIEDWAGQQITLYASSTKLAGEMVECLRIRPQVTIPSKPAITAARFQSALKAVQDGAYPADKVRANFDLTEDQENALREVLNVATV